MVTNVTDTLPCIEPHNEGVALAISSYSVLVPGALDFVLFGLSFSELVGLNNSLILVNCSSPSLLHRIMTSHISSRVLTRPRDLGNHLLLTMLPVFYPLHLYHCHLTLLETQ